MKTTSVRWYVAGLISIAVGLSCAVAAWSKDTAAAAPPIPACTTQSIQ